MTSSLTTLTLMWCFEKMTRREFYVFKIGQRSDDSQPHVAMGATQQAAVARRADRTILRNPPRPADDLQLVEAPPSATDDGFGFAIHRADRAEMKYCFTTIEAAQRYASEQAVLHPKTLFGVFGCVKIFETTTPQIIQKVFNDAGELILATE